MKIEIETGSPVKVGTYIAYTDSGISQYPKKELLVWSKNKWNHIALDQIFRPIVYGWIGPLPSPSTANLKYKEIKYAIATMTGREFNSFKAGVFNTLNDAIKESADDGDFIWEIHPSGDKKAIAKWSNNKWIFRKGKKK